jgi:hypothetical protein
LTKNKGSGDISEISGGEEAKPNEFPWAARIFGGCAQGEIYLSFMDSANITFHYS